MTEDAASAGHRHGDLVRSIASALFRCRSDPDYDGWCAWSTLAADLSAALDMDDVHVVRCWSEGYQCSQAEIVG